MSPEQLIIAGRIFAADLHGEFPDLTCRACGRTWAQVVDDALRAGALPVAAKYGQRWTLAPDGSALCPDCAPPEPYRPTLDGPDDSAMARFFRAAGAQAARDEAAIVWALLTRPDPAS